MYVSVDLHTYALYIRSMITHHIVYYNNDIDIDIHICIGRYVDILIGIRSRFQANALVHLPGLLGFALKWDRHLQRPPHKHLFTLPVSVWSLSRKIHQILAVCSLSRLPQFSFCVPVMTCRLVAGRSSMRSILCRRPAGQSPHRCRI